MIPKITHLYHLKLSDKVKNIVLSGGYFSPKIRFHFQPKMAKSDHTQWYPNIFVNKQRETISKTISQLKF